MATSRRRSRTAVQRETNLMHTWAACLYITTPYKHVMQAWCSKRHMQIDCLVEWEVRSVLMDLRALSMKTHSYITLIHASSHYVTGSVWTQGLHHNPLSVIQCFRSAENQVTMHKCFLLLVFMVIILPSLGLSRYMNRNHLSWLSH